MQNYKNVLLIDNNIRNYNNLVESANSDTFPLLYDYNTTQNDVREILKNNFIKIDRFGLIFHGSENSPIFLNNELLFEKNINNNMQFIIDIIKEYNIQKIDYFGCDTLLYDNWNIYYNTIYLETNIIVNAAKNKIGNIDDNNNWVLEFNNIQEDVKNVYFTENILNYSGILANPTVDSITASNITTSSATITYTNLDNSQGQGGHAHLIRYINTIPPDTLTSNYDANLGQISATSSGSISDTGLIPNKFYTYAFYDSTNTSGQNVGQIIRNTGGQPVYATLKTYISITAISISGTTSPTISYTAQNSLNINQFIYLIRYSGTITPPTVLDASGTVLDSNGSQIPMNSTSTNTAYDATTVSNNSYTYAFYNGTGINATILTDASNNSMHAHFTRQSPLLNVSSLSSSEIYNTSLKINATIVNSDASHDASACLYRFTSSPPSILSGGALIASNTVNKNTSITTSNSDTNLTLNTTYYYAFYNGTNSGTSTIITNDSSSQILTVKTKGISATLTKLSASQTTASMSYTINNAIGTSSDSVYLYRINGSFANQNLVLTDASLLRQIDISGNQQSITTVSGSYTDNNLTTNTFYTYAVYSSNIANAPQLSYFIIKTNPDINSMSVSNIINTSARINYNITNTISDTTVYLFRFPSIPPTSLNSSDSRIAKTNFIINLNTTQNSFYSDTGLTRATSYYYAFYDGSSDGAKQLTNTSGTTVSTSLTTLNCYITSLTSKNITDTSATIDVSANNTLSGASITLYLYRFLGLTAPTNLNIVSGIAISNGNLTIGANASATNSYTDSGLSNATNYTYAYYEDSVSNAQIITDNNNTAKSVSVLTTNVNNVKVLAMTPTLMSSTSITLKYTLKNFAQVARSSYLYRFNSVFNSQLNLSSGTYKLTDTLDPNATHQDITFTDTGLTTGSNYTYIFYDNNISAGVMLKSINDTYMDASNNPIYATFRPSYNITVASINSIYPGDHFNTVYYTLSNGNGSTQTGYLFRSLTSEFNGVSLDSSANYITDVSVNSLATVSGSFKDSTIAANKSYTYGFYGYSSPGSSLLLNYDASQQSSSITTSGFCFHPRTPILTTNGFIPIEELTSGVQLIILDKNNQEKIATADVYFQDILRNNIYYDFGNDIKVTKWHLMLEKKPGNIAITPCIKCFKSDNSITSCHVCSAVLVDGYKSFRAFNTSYPKVSELSKQYNLLLHEPYTHCAIIVSKDIERTLCAEGFILDPLTDELRKNHGFSKKN